MPRVISFVVLLAIALLIGALFFQVMAQFLVPLFLAVLLQVMFRPLHDWFIVRCRGRNRLAAGLTTLAILLILLLPLTWILVRAVSEAFTLAHWMESHQQELVDGVADAANDLRQVAAKVGVELPKDNRDLIATVKTELAQVAQKFAAPAALGGLQYTVGILVGLAIMVVALYYFLADGPAMINTIMRLSPLEDRYEEQLLAEFTKISRAVVVASLLSAFVQGILAAFGYFLAGLDMVFMLSATTMFLALVPFVGAAGVWIPCCLWLYFSNQTTTAIVLTVYCAAIVSMADNVIKPLVLHGQSGIHPLMGLLSVLGGVTVLGPIGILVGPMLVAFLQALLNMLNSELESMRHIATADKGG
ncbi:MAG: AI-2E family transporter [Pirellulales bacterium]